MNPELILLKPDTVIPVLQLVKDFPSSVKTQDIQNAIYSFVEEVADEGVDKRGMQNQLVKSITAATVMKMPGKEFWLAEVNGKVAGFAIASIVQDIDDRLTYWVSVGWASPEHRNGKGLKLGWQNIEKRAKQLMCSHLINVTNRNPEAYMRVLGPGWSQYATILRKNL